jgi:hypothetical protein
MKQQPIRPVRRSAVGPSLGTRLLGLMLAFLVGATAAGAGFMLAWGATL